MRENDACHELRAIVGWETATEYCAARGAALPSWAEWMRAVRGERRRIPEAILRATCPIEKGLDLADSSCVVTNDNGVRFTINSAYEGEWTRERDCSMGRQVRGRHEPEGVPMFERRIDAIDATVARAGR